MGTVAETHSPEIRERAVRRGFEPEADAPAQWAAFGSIAEKIGRVV
jgi:hypothetical protein